MKTRRFGRTDHRSTLAILGGFAFSEVTQARADEVMEKVIDAGINHIDVAPSYGRAEERLGPWLARERGRFFVGCKTTERTKQGAAREMRESLERLQIDAFDLYQLHAVTSLEELDEATAADGALQAILDAQQEGLTRFIGITTHGMDAPSVLLEALSRFDFDSVLFPVNFVLYSDDDYRRTAEELLQVCLARDVGMMAIKAIAKGLWEDDGERTYTTWYQPFDQPEDIQRGIDFALSQGVSGLCTVGDISLLPRFVAACESFTPMDEEEQEAIIAKGEQYEPIFN